MAKWQDAPLVEEPKWKSAPLINEQAPYEPEKETLSEMDQLRLFESMRGKLPDYSYDFRNLPPNISPEFKTIEPIRRQAYAQLKGAGFNDDQIQTVLDIQKKIKPGFIESMKRNAGQTAGGIGGAIAGAKIAGSLGQIPPLTALPEEFVTIPVGAGIGAFIGGGAGKAAQQTISPYESPSLRSFMKAGTEEAAYELGGRAVGGALKALPIFKKPVAETESGIAQKMFKEAGGFFTPAQRDKRLLVRASEQLSRGSFGGEQIFKEFNTKQVGQAIEVGDEIVKRIARDTLKDPSTLGKELDNIFSLKGGTRYSLLDEFFDPLYKEVDSLTKSGIRPVTGTVQETTGLLDESGKPILKSVQKKIGEEFTGATVSTQGLKDFAKQTLEKNAMLLQEGEKGKDVLLTPQARTYLEGILSLKDKISFSGMRDLRSKLLKDVRKMSLDADQSEGMIKQISKLANDAIFDPRAAEGLTPEARRLLKNTNAVYASAGQLYDNSFIKEVSRKLSESPSSVIKTVYKDLDPERLRSIRNTLVSPVPKKYGTGTQVRDVTKEFRELRGKLTGTKAERLISKNAAEGRNLWKQLNAAWLSDVIEKSYNPSDGTINVRRIDKIFRDMPDETFKLMFPGEQGEAVKSQIKLFETISGNKQGLSSLFGKGIEFAGSSGIGASLSAGSGIGIAANGALVLTPAAYARLATNPKATKLLTLGLKARKGSVKIAPIAARLIEILQKDDEQAMLDAIKEQKRIRRKETEKRYPGETNLRYF